MKSLACRLWVFAVVLVFSLSACAAKNPPANYFFEGKALEAAVSIDRGDMKDLRYVVRDLDVNARGRDGVTLLVYAILNNNFEAIKVLVEAGSDVGGRGFDGSGTVINMILYGRDSRFLRSALDGGLSPDYSDAEARGGNTLLIKSAGRVGSLEKVKMLLEYGAGLEGKNGLGDTALMEAISDFNYDIASFLVERGANFEYFDELGVTPAWALQLVIDGQKPSSPNRREFEKIRDSMIARGIRFPPDSPDVVREQMRRQGIEPVVPAGLLR